MSLSAILLLVPCTSWAQAAGPAVDSFGSEADGQPASAGALRVRRVARRTSAGRA